MSNPYDVSHIYDETGSAKARYHEFLRAGEARHLANRLKRSDDGLKARILSSFDTALVTLDNLRVSPRFAQVVKTFWWVPAGFAVLVLLRAIMGG
jgi:hypothetical protein